MSRRVAERVARLDWKRLGSELSEQGFARLPRLLSAAECAELSRLYDEDARFRATIEMGRHRFGEGEYRYLARPLPALVEALREAFYAPLAEIANAWNEALGAPERFPPLLGDWLVRCAAGGQTRPTPLLLRYGAGGYNRLHQDLYGALVFPIQLTCLLSRPGDDFEGGEFLLVEQRPRMQSRGEAIALERGEGILFATRERPVRGARGWHRAQLRHGVSRVRAGRRTTLGVIFHDAK